MEGEMEESNIYIGHQHPLILLKEDHQLSSKAPYCWRCWEKVVSVPCFGCVEEGCGAYLHKVCAGAPLELNHPFHPQHPLVMKTVPYDHPLRHRCKICFERSARLMYHCSCHLSFHIRCAMSTFNMAKNTFEELEGGEDDRECFVCWEPSAKYPYFSLDRRVHLHKKCAELPLKMNHRCHRKHPLTLQFITDRFLCAICQRGPQGVLVYGCSPCGLFIHFQCLSPPRNIESKTHPHPFTLFWRQGSVICDACGTHGNHAMYTCGTCDIIVHKNCISLPRFIKSKWHDHRLSHTYFFHREYMGILDCVICHEEVNTEHGSYSCSKCNDIFHVNCVTKDEESYVIVEEEEEEPLDIFVNSLTVLDWNDAGEAIIAQHFKHIHYLRLSDRVSEHESKCCDGCLLPISASFYYCSRCEFYLHKTCAELPKVKYVWHHRCQQPLVLTSNHLFFCERCGYLSNSFSYKCEECNAYICLRCIVALTPGARTCLAHKHNPLLFYIDYKEKCNACGEGDTGMFRCKDCDVCLDVKCFSLSITIQHKCDEHLLSLIEQDDNSYSESHFCDICEGNRDLNFWFYHCARCATSAHVKCVLGNYSFIKLGSIFEGEHVHEHPLTLVKRVYYYPNCNRCEKRCLDFALECLEPGCNYITHIDCPHDNFRDKNPLPVYITPSSMFSDRDFQLFRLLGLIVG